MINRLTTVNSPGTPNFAELRGLIIVPAFNERQSVGKLVKRLRRALPPFDVLVIDDGSTDDTIRQVPPETAVVSLPFNLGIGGAMQAGYRYAALHGYDVAVQVDGDGQHRPGEVVRLVRELLRSGSDLVVGSRFLGPGGYKQSLPRMIGIHVLDAMIQLLGRISITDCTSGFRVANRRVIRAFAHWYPDDYPEPEVILLLHRAGFKVTELGVSMRRRRAGMTSIPLGRGLFYVLKVSLALVLDIARDPWPHGKVGEAGESAATEELTHDPQPDPPRVRFQPAGAWPVRRLRQFKLKERYSLLFGFLGLPFLLLAVWPDGAEALSRVTHIERPTVLLLGVSMFLILVVFELLTIVSTQDRKITTLAQLVGILMEQQKLVDRQHHGITPKDQTGQAPTE